MIRNACTLRRRQRVERIGGEERLGDLADRQRLPQHRLVHARYADAAAIELAALDLDEGLVAAPPGVIAERHARLARGDREALPVVLDVDLEPRLFVRRDAGLGEVDAVHRARYAIVDAQDLRGQGGNLLRRPVFAEQEAHILRPVGRDQVPQDHRDQADLVRRLGVRRGVNVAGNGLRGLAEGDLLLHRRFRKFGSAPPVPVQQEALARHQQAGGVAGGEVQAAVGALGRDSDAEFGRRHPAVEHAEVARGGRHVQRNLERAAIGGDADLAFHLPGGRRLPRIQRQAGHQHLIGEQAEADRGQDRGENIDVQIAHKVISRLRTAWRTDVCGWRRPARGKRGTCAR